jgi:hypothetical protein
MATSYRADHTLKMEAIYIPPKRQLQLNRLYGVRAQKMILFITTAVKTSNLTFLPTASTICGTQIEPWN